jgi:tetratricopeptide (TPR) repeat protein
MPSKSSNRNHKKLNKGFIIYLIACFIFGIISGIFEIKLKILHVVFIGLLAGIIYYYWETIPSRKAFKFMKEGNYDEAISIFDNLREKYKNRKRDMDAVMLNTSICYHRKGKFEKSIELLEMLHFDSLKNTFKGLYLSLYSNNLFMLEMDLKKAVEFSNKSFEILKFPGDLLILGNLSALIGNEKAADKTIERYFKLKEQFKSSKALLKGLFIDKHLSVVYENFMLGQYYYMKKDLDTAKDYLNKACECKYRNIYSDKAVELLELV